MLTSLLPIKKETAPNGLIIDHLSVNNTSILTRRYLVSWFGPCKMVSKFDCFSCSTIQSLVCGTTHCFPLSSPTRVRGSMPARVLSTLFPPAVAVTLNDARDNRGGAFSWKFEFHLGSHLPTIQLLQTTALEFTGPTRDSGREFCTPAKLLEFSFSFFCYPTLPPYLFHLHISVTL